MMEWDYTHYKMDYNFPNFDKTISRLNYQPSIYLKRNTVRIYKINKILSKLKKTIN